jgi:hypothetical protein
METGGRFARTVPRAVLARAARKHAVVIRIIVISIMVLALLVPLLMVRALVAEREQRRGGAQTLAGPILTVPGVARIPGANGIPVDTVQLASFLPDALVVEGSASRSAPAGHLRGRPLHGIACGLRGFPSA